MKEKILVALKAKFPGVNANVLGRIAEMYAKTVTTEEAVTTTVEGVTQELINMVVAYGDSRATDAQKTAVANYELKYGLKDGAKVDSAAGDPTDADATKTTIKAEETETVPSWAKTHIESNQKLRERLDKMDGERTTADRKQQLSKVVAKLPANLRKAYDRISVDKLTDEEFNAMVGDVKTEVEGMILTSTQKGQSSVNRPRPMVAAIKGTS